MRSLPVVLFLIIVGTTAAMAEKRPQTEAERDGLIGSVHSVVMTDQTILFKLDPADTWVVQGILSGSEEYDRNGYQTKIGNDQANGEFLGEINQFVRDANGRVIERTIRTLPAHDLIEHDVYGPFGLVESTFFSSGEPTLVHTVHYDQLGNVLDESTIDGNGKPMGRTVYRRDSKGAWTERTMWIQGVLHSFETYNPESDFQRYEQYDKSGNVITTFTHSKSRVQTYWSASTDPDGGTTVVDDLDNGDTRTTFCHNQGRTCDGRTRHAVYMDLAKHNPIMTEIFSDGGTPLVRAFYEYQIDEHENWTTRKVWVQPRQQGERTLYETDSRTITYWPE
jgi:hypothetical protein